MPTPPSSEELFHIAISGIHNSGVFAATDIKKDQYIVEYLGEKITKKESQRRAEEWESEARTKGFGLVYIFELNKRYDIDGNIENNPAKFINHSCEPNCEAINDNNRIWIAAKRKIKKGEELTYDYGYDMENFLDHKCLCGKKSCIGYIVREDLRPKVKKLLRGRRAKTSSS